MARRVFFSFKYKDVSRAMVVRNSWVTQGREAAGFIAPPHWSSRRGPLLARAPLRTGHASWPRIRLKHG